MPIIEKELQKRALPDLFVMPNGERASTKEEWENILRSYWREILLKEEYGKLPEKLTPTVTTERMYVDFSGKATWDKVYFTFEREGKTHTVTTQLFAPADGEKHPFFIYLNFRENIPDMYLPVEELIDNGFGIFTVCYTAVTSDNGDFSSGLAGLFSTEPRKEDEAGKIVHWAYMAMQMMDYLRTRPEADPSAIGISGHSRLGKTALLTAALDERFAFVCSNNSGCSGAALTRCRCEGGESVKSIWDRFPFWFCPNFEKYSENVEAMPFDQHCLLALVAPRAAYIGGALMDVWADNDNQFLNCVAATPVWELYGKTGLVTPDKMPECGDTLTEGDVGYHLRAGKHFQSRTDWLVYMDAVKKYLAR